MRTCCTTSKKPGGMAVPVGAPTSGLRTIDDARAQRLDNLHEFAPRPILPHRPARGVNVLFRVDLYPVFSGP